MFIRTNPEVLEAAHDTANFFLLQALHYKKFSTASDVWSFGALMFEIWSLGHKPFEGKTNNEVCFIYIYIWETLVINSGSSAEYGSH